MFVTVTLAPAMDCAMTVSGDLALGKVHRVKDETLAPGGKGINVARVLAANGRPVCAGGIIGQDRASDFTGFLDRAGVASDFMVVSHATRVNMMVVDDSGHEIKFNREAYPRMDMDWPALEAYIRRVAADADVVILGGVLPARFPLDTYGRLVSVLAGMDKRVVVDAAGPALAHALRGRLAVIKPTRAELAEALGEPIADEAQLVAAVRRLTRLHDLVIVSDGPHGVYFAQGERIYVGWPPAVFSRDSTGAGDSLLGQACADFFGARPTRIGEGLVARAVGAGCAAVERRGVPTPSLSRINELATAVRVATVD